MLADMGFGAGADIATAAEGVCVFADRELFDQGHEEFPLDRFEASFGSHDEAFAAGPFRDGEGHVVRLSFPFTVDGKEPKLLEGDAEMPGEVVLGFPKREPVALKLVLVGEQIAQIPVAGADGSGEETFGFGQRHDLFSFAKPELASGGFWFREQAFVAQGAAEMIWFQGAAGGVDDLIDGVVGAGAGGGGTGW